MRYSISFATALFLGSLVVSSWARAQITLEAVPVIQNGITEPDRSNLARPHSELERRKLEIEAGVAELKVQCGRVDSQDSGRVADCRTRNRQLRLAIADYARRLASFRCALATPSVVVIKHDIESNQQAIRNIGLGTTVDAYERLEEMTKEQKDEFQAAMIEATVTVLLSGLLDVVKKGNLAVASTRKNWNKRAIDLGIDNPHFLEALEAFSEAKDKPAMARALNEVIDSMKFIGQASYKAYSAGGAKSDADRAWKLAGFALAFFKEIAPQMAEQLAEQFPSFAVGFAKNLTVQAGVAVASPVVTFAHNMRALGYTRQAVQQLDVATDQQLDAVDRLHVRMKTLVDRLREQRSILSRCPA